jgi:hypothetical protein
MYSTLTRNAALSTLLIAACIVASAEEAAQAPAVALTVLETDPATDAQLHYKEPFYVRFQVRTGTPVRVLAEAYYQGQEVPVATIRERELRSDGGTDATLIFHWPERATPVDEIRLVATRFGQRQPAATLSVPVNLIWGSEPAYTARALPQWVHDFEAQREREHALDPDYQAYRKAMSKTRTGWVATVLIGCAGIALGGAAWVLLRRRSRRSAKAEREAISR